MATAIQDIHIGKSAISSLGGNLIGVKVVADCIVLLGRPMRQGTHDTQIQVRVGIVVIGSSIVQATVLLDPLPISICRGEAGYLEAKRVAVVLVTVIYHGDTAKVGGGGRGKESKEDEGKLLKSFHGEKDMIVVAVLLFLLF